MNADDSGQVLVIDDNTDLLAALKQTLTAAGYRCTVAQGGNAAYRAFLVHEPDLIVTDLHMAGGNGLGFMRQVRAQSNLPILVITGHYHNSIRERMEQEFPDVPVLLKPFSRKRFLELVATAMEEGPSEQLMSAAS